MPFSLADDATSIDWQHYHSTPRPMSGGGVDANTGTGEVYRVDGVVPGPPSSTFSPSLNNATVPPAAATVTAASVGGARPPVPTVFFDEDPICCKFCQARSLVFKAILLGVLVVAFVTTIAVVLTTQSKDSSVLLTDGGVLRSSTGIHSSTGMASVSSTGVAGNNNTNITSSSSSSTGANYTSSSSSSITQQRVNYTTRPGWGN
jgi:hypothetical protein